MTDRAKVVRAEVLQVGLTMLEPFRTSFGSTSRRTVVLIRLTDADGLVGWGEAAPLDHPFYLPDTVSGAFSVIVEYALPLCAAAGAAAGQEAAAAMASIRRNTFSPAG